MLKNYFLSNEGNIIDRIMEKPEILSSDIKSTLTKMNRTTRWDGTEIEILSTLDDYGIEKITEIINLIYNRGEIPEGLSRVIFVALPKKEGTSECKWITS